MWGVGVRVRGDGDRGVFLVFGDPTLISGFGLIVKFADVGTLGFRHEFESQFPSGNLSRFYLELERARQKHKSARV